MVSTKRTVSGPGAVTFSGRSTGLKAAAGVPDLPVVVGGQDHLVKAVPRPLRSEVHLADGGRLVAQAAKQRRQRVLAAHYLAAEAVVVHAVGEDRLAGHD